jgi:O-acetyl-ADP-ribose deacetylase (regulator of RNase III)
MISFVTGDILKSEAECLVNTVNCEGYMGKGIAYQFKLAYPETNKDYVKSCKSGHLRIGTLHYYKENNKLIINFPTKDKWREKSELEYISRGLSELAKLIYELRISSIAIPPLGCGNGGLNWSDVKELIVNYLESSADDLDVYIFEPSNYYKSKVKEAPQISASHLIIMKFKPHLKKFDRFHIHKCAYFLNVLIGENYFKFKKHIYGPYAHSIDVLIKDINEYQNYYGFDTEMAYNHAKQTLISKSVQNKLDTFDPYIKQSIRLVNSINTSKELELLSSVCCIIEENPIVYEETIVNGIKDWSEEKAKKFSKDDIIHAIITLQDFGIVQKELSGGYLISKRSKLLTVNS